jgi:signal transduction histidine kinase
LQEISRITNEYGALHRRTVRDLARSRAELAQARTVLGTVAHDLRTPLSTVLGFTELLLDDEELTPAQRELGQRVDRAARSMTTLTEELVETVIVGASPLRSTPVDLLLVVKDVITRHQLLHPPRGVRVVLDRDLAGDAPVIVQGDEAKLERLLDNLVSNALKFSPDDGIVHVSVSRDAQHAEIRVRDDGPGLPAEQLDAIFSPFHRAPGAAAVPGVGLGLTIVKQITERHGGRVHAESVVGAGATFVVRLPLGSRTRETAAPSRPTPPDQAESRSASR